MSRHQQVLSVVALLSFASTCFGQTSGTIGGVVTDQSGAVIPNATVSAGNSATGVVTKVTSLSDGKYLLSNLTPGMYTLSAEMQGFKGYSSSNIEVHVSDRLTIDIPLQVGESRDTVTVSDEAPLLRAEDAQTGEVINNTFISNLPQLNRNPFALLALSGDATGTSTDKTLSLNGGRTASVDYYVDGGVINSGQGNGITNQTPSMDAVAEFKVVTSGVSAEFGRISGGYVTLVTKSGTNAYHGSLYEYMFNDMFNANAWGQNAIGNPKVHFRQNDYGFTLGGPVSIPKLYSGKNKTFFFVDNEYLKKTQAGSITLNSVPTAAERNGDLRNTIYQGNTYLAYDPFGPQAPGTGSFSGFYQRLQLLGGDGRNVPQSLISPVSQAILKLIPDANRPSTAGSSSLNNYGYASALDLNTFRFGVRIDENLTQNQRFYIRYATFSSNQATTPTMNTPLYTSNVLQSNGGGTGNINYTWIARPTVIVDFRNSVTFQPTLNGAQHPAGFDNSFLPKVYQTYLGTNDVPNIANTFMSGTAYGQAAATAIINSTSYNFGGTVTKILSRHTLKTGYEYRRYYDNFTNIGAVNQMNFMVDPVYQYSNDWGLGAVQGRVTGLASFLMGINDRNNIAKPTTRAMNTNYLGAFVQDDWKVTSKLTLNLGLRWDNERPTTERGDKLYFWDASHPSLFPVIPGYNFASALAAAGLPEDTPVPDWAKTGKFDPGAVMIAGSKDFPARSPQQPKNLQFAPRIGIAYQLNKKTVLRAFGGKMYLGTTGNPNSYATSNSSVALSDQALAGWHASTDGGRTYISTWANPFPLSSMFTNYTRDVLTANLQSSADPGATAIAGDMHMPREYDWAFNVQRQLPQNFILEVGYTANRGLGLLATDTISHYPADLLVPKYAVPMQKPIASPNAGETLETTITGSIQQLGLLEYQYPYYGRVQVAGINEGRSFYQAMTVRFEHRMSHGLQALVNYTFSRSQDDVGSPDTGLSSIAPGGATVTTTKTVQSVESFREAWGLSTNDQTQRLNIAYTYEFPLGKGRHWLGSANGFGRKALDTVVGGWQLAGNWAYTSGTPITLTGSSTSNVNNAIKVNQTWGSYASSDHNLTPASYSSDGKVLYSGADPIPALTVTSAVRRLDPTKVVGAQLFILGNLPPNDGAYRNPGFYQMDMSLMKNFAIREGKYLQIRAEAQNAFNIRGFGPYNASIGTNTYGLITTAGNQPRQIQLSARINF